MSDPSGRHGHRRTTRGGPAGSRESVEPRSLRGRIVTAVVAVTLIGLTGVALATLASERARDELSLRTDAIIEEQRIADRIGQAVMRQLATAYAYADPQGTAEAAFRAAGDTAYSHLQRFLFRDLSPEQRLQLERIKEEHRLLEVKAARALDLLRRGRAAQAESARAEMARHAVTLLDEMDRLLTLREAELVRLRARQDRTFRTIYLSAAALALVLMLTSIGLVWLLYRTVTRPLVGLTEAASAIGAGDFDVRVPRGSIRELAVVADGFNQMAENLHAAKRDLEERNEELQAALEQVRAAQEEAIRAEKLSAIGRMSAGIAHELNNPLAAVLGYGELLAARLDEVDLLRTDEIRDEYLAPILQESARAQHLVRNFLAFSRRSEDRLEPVRLADAVDVVVGLRAHAFTQAGLRLEVADLPDRWVLADRQLLEGVLLNLINNALDAMRPLGRGALRITGTASPDGVSVVFEDEGPGIEPGADIFEPFFTTKPVGQGTGLGLALVQRHMERFGGSVDAGNREEGGARFTLRLQAAEQPEEEPSGSDRDAVVPSELRATDARILIVEDEAPLRALQQRILCKIDARTTAVASASEARRVLLEEEVDLVVSDVKMPGESGLSLYEWVTDRQPDLADRFIFVTGDLATPEVQVLSERRPEMFIAKPFSLREYLERVMASLAVTASRS